MNEEDFIALCKNGKFKEALALALQGREKAKYSPSRFSMDKNTGKPIFYRGNKRVEMDADGEWQLAKNTR
ncbi:hypothetical protein FHT86_002898 [Rhizobium sp. BK313]|jgi:hypothetical protein|uniref:hypothetical protein n=1 Tax=Rhizobium sp. BK313 TaxID=2587081 RepID=UPI00105B8ED5|nr:hypothetical protein [Rhizobium sp. BK313]MBB3454599.1 hypothetical protein [Rhizobium sp. BK313]